ncbi:DEAD/DEAH box helicase [Halosquirtibacter laminarini]|uniref:DEAD/DEAH box helicase n=1 Tax=Halosquirtibacter laminarini TaxID=3374600 RepID=A0AC61NCV6_9BACT|nr:DEAD/DEAH box helicase [Prolixibacteraceae bacterium]
MKSFQELGVSKSILKTLGEIGFEEPTPIQEKAIPAIKSGKDVLGIAQTGTGKTAAYLMPIFGKLVKAEGVDPRVVILVPTRELSMQVGEDIEELLTYSNLRYASVYGGVGWTKHAELIEPGIDILVATPGRLWDLYRAGAVSFKKVKTLVIDEADRMLDMGFMPQIRNFLEVLPVKRQNLLFSATFPTKVEEMSYEFLDFPTRIEVAPSATPAEKVSQYYYPVQNYRSKLNLISNLLKDEDTFKRVIVFCGTKGVAEGVYKVIKRKSEGEVRVLHSNKGQSTRINAINAFKEGEVRILISTDVSARGIDVSEVSHVINFEMPNEYEDYVHRIGRTARANMHGVAISFIGEDELFHKENIEELMRVTIEELPIPEDVEIIPLSKKEKLAQLREIDLQKKKSDPNFKGAFHEKKKRTPRKHPTSFNPKSSKLRGGRKKGAPKN